MLYYYAIFSDVIPASNNSYLNDKTVKIYNTESLLNR